MDKFSKQTHAIRSEIDIVYDDPEYQVAGKCNQIHYWNQTN